MKKILPILSVITLLASPAMADSNHPVVGESCVASDGIKVNPVNKQAYICVSNQWQSAEGGNVNSHTGATPSKSSDSGYLTPEQEAEKLRNQHTVNKSGNNLPGYSGNQAYINHNQTGNHLSGQNGSSNTVNTKPHHNLRDCAIGATGGGLLGWRHHHPILGSVVGCGAGVATGHLMQH